jgi:hypothetical protein
MKVNVSFNHSDEYAVSELVGGLLLVLIAIMVFSAIYLYVFPLPIPPAESNVKLEGYVTNDGLVVIEHKGGESLTYYRTDVKYINGTLIDTTTYQSEEDPWQIGEYNYPLGGIYLLTEDDAVHITIYEIKENSEEAVFDGVIKGKTQPTPPDNPMLISSLRTNTVDEDLICFNYTIVPQINASTYIYNWSIDGNSITYLLMPFDTNSSDNVKDYSSDNNGTAFGPLWNESGVVGGSYQFDGIDDYISIPYCFDGSLIDEITVEAWIKTNSTSGTIASFNRSILWELSINNGLTVWSTNANSNITNTVGVTNVSDGTWHHIATTYDYFTGNSVIYVDGNIEKNENAHNPLEQLGTGDTPTGSVGLGSEAFREIIFSTGFETQNEEDEWEKDEDRTDDWAENAVFDRFASDSLNPRTGSYCIGGAGDLVYWFERHHAAYNRTGIDISQYSDVNVSVWYSYKDTESDDEFGLYYWDGSDWEAIFEEFNPETGGDGQEPWTHVEVQIPDSIDTLVLQFWWSTSADREYMAIDDLEVTGISNAGGGNFSGYIDEFYIYNHALSSEQVYQNYLSTKNGYSDRRVIVSEETSLGDLWKCTVTPNDTVQDDTPVESNTLQIVSYGGG